MKKVIIAALLAMSATVAFSQHFHNHHRNNSDRVLGSVLTGIIIGAAVTRASQPEVVVQPPVYIPPPVHFPQVREYYPCIITVVDPRTGWPRQEFATCVR